METHFALRMSVLFALGLALAGCGPGGSWLALVIVIALVASGCATSRTSSSIDASSRDSGPGDAPFPYDGHVHVRPPDAGVSDAGGTWDACCVGGHDAGPVVDAGDPGSWEPCCDNGRVSSCFCPGGAICNYGLFEQCGDGYCTYPGGECPNAIDAGSPPDAGGSWEPCCQGGVITTCFCPADWACNYAWFTNCGDGTCSSLGGVGCADGSGLDAGSR